jgi:subtilisin family serine protease
MTIRAWWRAGALAVLSTAPLAACLDEKSTGPRSDDSPSLQTTRTTQGTSPHHIVVMRADIPANFAAVVRSLNGRVVRSHQQIGVVSVAGLSTQAAARLARQPGVEAVSLDRRLQWLPPAGRAGIKARRRFRDQTDQSGASLFEPFQWNIRQIRADDAWLTTPQGTGALVCVLDTGVDPDHIDLAGKVDLGRSASFEPAEPSILDFHFHGTAVSSIIATNGIGIASVAPDARLCAVKVLDINVLGGSECRREH